MHKHYKDNSSRYLYLTNSTQVNDAAPTSRFRHQLQNLISNSQLHAALYKRQLLSALAMMQNAPSFNYDATNGPSAAHPTQRSAEKATLIPASMSTLLSHQSSVSRQPVFFRTQRREGDIAKNPHLRRMPLCACPTCACLTNTSTFDKFSQYHEYSFEISRPAKLKRCHRPANDIFQEHSWQNANRINADVEIRVRLLIQQTGVTWPGKL